MSSLLRLFVPDGADYRKYDGPWRYHVNNSNRRKDGWGFVERIEDLPTADDLSLVAPSEVVHLCSLVAPEKNKSLFLQSVGNAIEERLMTDIGSIHVVAAPRESLGVYPIAAIDKEWLDAVLDYFNGHGLTPERMEIETALPPVDPKNASIVFGVNRGFILSYDYESYCFDFDPSKAPPESLRWWLTSEMAKTPLAGIVAFTYPDAAMPDIQSWSDELGIAISPSGAIPPEALGAEPIAGINLLTGEFAPPRPALSPSWTYKSSIAVTLLSLLLFAFTFSEKMILERRADHITNEINNRFDSIFPGAVIVDAPLQTRRKLAEMRLLTGDQRAQGEFLVMLPRFTDSWGLGTKIGNIDYTTGKLKIMIENPDKATLATAKATLGEIGYILASSRPSPSGSVRVVMTVKE